MKTTILHNAGFTVIDVPTGAKALSLVKELQNEPARQIRRLPHAKTAEMTAIIG